ncbi:MAG: hydrogenase expression/formation protein HypE [Ignavibacteriales bacterium]|nr:hydrogenase expression/formation protein HypE [Ignavibacteriales bacterium]
MDVNEVDSAQGFTCPLPINNHERILLAHGGGGKLTQDLIQKIFLLQLKNEFLLQLHDGAVFSINGSRLAFTTDSFVVDPIFFPGRDIGMLAVNGTVNDLAMCGARPLYLSIAFILEEGCPMHDVRRVVSSVQEAAKKAEVIIVTGDTKVVERGKCDKMFINTSGIGVIEPGVDINSRRARQGDKVILSGRIANHGIAVMSTREGLEFETELRSDCAPLHGLVEAMFHVTKDIHVLRDPTRGGVASALNEIAASARVGIHLHETTIPIAEEVEGACEILGFDPLYVANEGILLALVAPKEADLVLAAMRKHHHGLHARIIGEVVRQHTGVVTMKTKIGGTRVVDMLSGEQLPRIC